MHIRQDMPTPIVPKPGAKFIDFSPVEVARQICLIEFQDYQKIHPTECMHQSWTKKNKAEAAPSIGRMIKRSNSLPLWVATQILSEAEGKLRNRAKIVSNFIKIASELRKVNNFNAVMEITAGLQLSPIYRLKKTWEVSGPLTREPLLLYLCFVANGRSWSPRSSWTFLTSFRRASSPTATGRTTGRHSGNARPLACLTSVRRPPFVSLILALSLLALALSLAHCLTVSLSARSGRLFLCSLFSLLSI